MLKITTITSAIRGIRPMLSAFCILFYASRTFAAAPPQLIPFQGHLTRPKAGAPTQYEPVPDGKYDILFTLYTTPAGGEGRVWGPERQSGVVVINGLVNVLLGSVSGFQAAVDADLNFFGRVLYVGITIDADNNPNTADLELVPRQVLLPAMYAHNAGNAQQLQGHAWSDYFAKISAGGKDVNADPANAKAKDADKLDGIDTDAIFADPTNKTAPKAKLAALADAALSVDVTKLVGQIKSSQIADAAITTRTLANGSVTAAKLNNVFALIAPTATETHSMGFSTKLNPISPITYNSGDLNWQTIPFHLNTKAQVLINVSVFAANLSYDGTRLGFSLNINPKGGSSIYKSLLGSMIVSSYTDGRAGSTTDMNLVTLDSGDYEAIVQYHVSGYLTSTSTMYGAVMFIALPLN